MADLGRLELPGQDLEVGEVDQREGDLIAQPQIPDHAEASHRWPHEKRNTGPRAGNGRTAPAGIRNA